MEVYSSELYWLWFWWHWGHSITLAVGIDHKRVLRSVNQIGNEVELNIRSTWWIVQWISNYIRDLFQSICSNDQIDGDS